MFKINNSKLNKNLSKWTNLKKRTFIASCAALVSVAPVSICSSVATANQQISKDKYNFDGMNFNSYNDLWGYVNKNTKVQKIEGQNSKWTLQWNGQTKTFDDPSKLRNDLNNNFITYKDIKTDVDLKQYASKNGIIGLTNNSVWQHITKADSQNSIVYLGKNDVAYDSEEKAYQSYFDVHQGYYFNGIYFKSTSDLEKYLRIEYFPSKPDVKNTIVLKAPNGKSISINLSETNAYQLLSDFITENSEIGLSYQKNANEVLNINKNNLLSNVDNVSIQDLNYLHVQSNQGESRYIIDNKYTDHGNLIGPYFYNGVLDVASFKNKSMWRKVNGVTDKAFQQSKVDLTIGSFFSSIINDDNELNKQQAEEGNTNTLLFRTLLSTNDNKSYDAWFLDELKKLSPQLWNVVVKTNDDMMSGKKYNTFYKIPVLYSFLMQRAISWNLGQDVINLIIDYFTNVCNFIQDSLEMVSLYDQSILMDVNNKTKFDTVSFFQIGNPEYDLNTSTEYFLNELKTQYPKLVALAATVMAAENNITLSGGLIPFKSVDFSYIVDTQVISGAQFVEINKTLESVYNVFSQLDSKNMIALFIKNNHNQSIINIQNIEDESKWEEQLKKLSSSLTNQNIVTLLTTIGAKNTQYYSLAEANLKLEIQVFLETGAIANGGYLEQLYSYDKNILPIFINFVMHNVKEINVYRIYLAFLIDAKSNTNVFQGMPTNNTIDLLRRINLLVFLTLGTIALVSDTVAKIGNSLKLAISNPLAKLFKTKEYVYYLTDADGNRFDHTLNLGKANKDNKLIYLDDVDKIDGQFLNSDLLENGPTGNQKIVLSDMTAALRESNTDWPDFFLDFVEEQNEMHNRKLGQFSEFIDPSDGASINNASRFGTIDELASMAERSLDDVDSVGPSHGSYDAVDFGKTKKSWWSGASTKFNKFKKTIMSGISAALQVFTVVATVAEIAFFIYDLVKVTYTQNFYEYVTADGTKFYWDGGLTATKFMGFVNEEISSIADMELVDPIQITLPQIQEFYYYNGIKYFDTSEMKTKILLDFLNGASIPKSSKFSKYYYLLGQKELSTNKSINELINFVIKDLNVTKNENGSFDYSNLNKDSLYLSGLSVSYNYGYNITENDNYITLIENIIKNLRLSNLVVLPDLKNNVAIGTVSNEFVYPGKYFDGNKVVDNSSVNGYILVDNSANDLKSTNNNQILRQQDFIVEDAAKAVQQSKQKLYTTFKNIFSIAHKEVLNLAQTTNKYSSLSNNLTSQKIYLVKDPVTNATLTFIDLSLATEFLNKRLNVTKNVSYSNVYVFNNNIFVSKQDLVNYVNKLATKN